MVRSTVSAGLSPAHFIRCLERFPYLGRQIVCCDVTVPMPQQPLARLHRYARGSQSATKRVFKVLNANRVRSSRCLTDSPGIMNTEMPRSGTGPSQPQRNVQTSCSRHPVLTLNKPLRGMLRRVLRLDDAQGGFG